MTLYFAAGRLLQTVLAPYIIHSSLQQAFAPVGVFGSLDENFQLFISYCWVTDMNQGATTQVVMCNYAGGSAIIMYESLSVKFHSPRLFAATIHARNLIVRLRQSAVTI